jgi:hypothetical protein
MVKQLTDVGAILLVYQRVMFANYPVVDREETGFYEKLLKEQQFIEVEHNLHNAFNWV